MNFEFATATRIVFGAGRVRELGAIAAAFGRRALVITGANPTRAVVAVESLRAAGVESVVFPIYGEPTIESVADGATLARRDRCTATVGFGGGSAIDAAKAIAAAATNDGDLLDCLEVIGSGKPLSHPPAPFLAVPTTAGAGAEVTRNAVLLARPHRVKVSLRSPLLLARAAIIDPELTYRLPPEVTASTGMDALTQLIEPFVSCRANPMTDALCREGLALVARSLRKAHQAARDSAASNRPLTEAGAAARRDMALAALFGGLALTNAGLGAVHGFAAPLGGMFAAPHGSVCAALLPGAMEVNLAALEVRSPDHPARVRFAEVARTLTGDTQAGAREGVNWVRQLAADLGIPRLSAHGVCAAHATDVVAMAARASSMRGNPIELTASELEAILSSAL